MKKKTVYVFKGFNEEPNGAGWVEEETSWDTLGKARAYLSMVGGMYESVQIVKRVETVVSI